MLMLPIVRPFFTYFINDFDYGFLHLPEQDRGLAGGVIGQQEMLPPPRH